MVVHQALDAGHRRLLHDEEREAHLDVAGVGLEPRGHLLEHGAEGLDRDLALGVQDLDEARHVRALEVVGQAHVHVEVRDGVLLAGRAVLHPHRVADVLDADAVDRQPARVGAPLHVLDFGDGRRARSWRWRPGVSCAKAYRNSTRRSRASSAMRGSSSARRAHAVRVTVQRPPALDAGRAGPPHPVPRRRGSCRASRAR